MQPESYPLLRKKLENIFEDEFARMEDSYENGKIDYIPRGSIINKYGKKQQRKMLELLRAYVLEDKETTNQEDLILEELLYHIVTNDLEISYEMCLDADEDDVDGFKDSFNEWKAIFNAGEESEESSEELGELTDEDIFNGLNECLWWDVDWQLWEVEKRDYSKIN